MSRFRRKANHAHVYEIARQDKTHVTLRSLIENVLPRRTFEEDYEPAPGEPAAMACEDLAREALDAVLNAEFRLEKGDRYSVSMSDANAMVGKAKASRALAYDAIGSGVKAEEGWTGRKCPACKGHGRRMVGDDEVSCPDCGGTGDEWGALSTHTAAGAGPVGDCDICHGKTVATEPGEVLIYDQDNCPGCSPAVTHHAEKPARPVGEAVAWRVKDHADDWFLTDRAEQAAYYTEQGHAVIPLYTHPVEQPGEVERDPEAMAGAWAIGFFGTSRAREKQTTRLAAFLDHRLRDLFRELRKPRRRAALTGDAQEANR